VRLICGFLLWSSFPNLSHDYPGAIDLIALPKCFLGCRQRPEGILEFARGYGRERFADAASDCLEIFAAWSGRIDFIIRANRRKCQNWAAMFRAKFRMRP